MPYDLRFSDRHIYNSRPEAITVPALLRNGEKVVDLLAKIDTGAEDCLFDRGFAEALGLRVEEGFVKTYSTVNGRFTAYGPELTIEVLGVEVRATAYFYADVVNLRNVLGRRGWLDRIRFGVIDYDQTAYLASYGA